MYKVGDKVIHQQEGACYIREIVDVETDHILKHYYRLEPVFDKKTKIFISINAKNQNRIRPAIKLSALRESAENPPQEPWINNPKERYRMYSKSINTFEFEDVLQIYNNLSRQNIKKPLGSQDSQLLLIAEKLICSEIAIIFDQPYEFVLDKLRESALNEETLLQYK